MQSVPSSKTFGLSVCDDWSLFASTFVMMLNGRPDDSSTIGATVKSEKIFAQVFPFLQLFGEAIKPLKTKRCRWSNSESDRSARKFPVSCGIKSVCRSDESSIECDHV